MYRIIGYKNDKCIVIEDHLISEGVARAKYKKNISTYLEDFKTVEIDNSATKHIGL